MFVCTHRFHMWGCELGTENKLRMRIANQEDTYHPGVTVISASSDGVILSFSLKTLLLLFSGNTLLHPFCLFLSHSFFSYKPQFFYLLSLSLSLSLSLCIIFSLPVSLSSLSPYLILSLSRIVSALLAGLPDIHVERLQHLLNALNNLNEAIE